MTDGFSFSRALGAASRSFRAHWAAWLAATLALGLGAEVALEPVVKLTPDGAAWGVVLDLGYFFVTNIYFTVIILLAVSPPGTSYGAMLRRLPVAAVMVYLAEFVIHLPANLVDWFKPGDDGGLAVGRMALEAGGWAVGIVMHALLGMASPAIVAERLGPLDGLRRGWALARGRIWLLLGLGLAAEIGQAIVEGAGWILLPGAWGDWTGRAVSAIATAWYGLYYLLWGALFLELRRARDPMPAAETAQVFD